MIGFLASRFIKDYQNTSDAAVRRAYGVLCGAVGIVINLLLFALKLFAGTLAGHFLHWQIDGWCGLAVSLLILWAGVQAARDTLSPLLGQPPSEEFVQEIRDIVMANKAVCGIHDLVVHDYGPGRVMISLHAEVPAHGDILTLHDEIDNVEKQLHDKLGCEAVIHMDPIVTND